MEKRKVYKILFLCTGNSLDRFYEVVGKPVGAQADERCPPQSRVVREGSGTWCGSSGQCHGLHRAEKEEQRHGSDRDAHQEQVFRERKQPAHPGDERDAAPVPDDGVTGQVEQDG